MGRGIFDADSISFYSIPSQRRAMSTYKRSVAYPIAGLSFAIPNSFHDAPFLIADIFHPICLARSDKYMRGPTIDMAVQLLFLINFEALGILDLTGCAVMVAVFSIDIWVDLWKYIGIRFGYVISGSPGSQESFALG